jgi:hypothetical protein
VGTIQIECERSQPERSLFSAKFNSDYNDFVARVALEVVDGWWWKHQLRVKSADNRTTALSSNEGGWGQPLFTFASFCVNLSIQSQPIYFSLSNSSRHDSVSEN